MLLPAAIRYAMRAKSCYARYYGADVDTPRRHVDMILI